LSFIQNMYLDTVDVSKLTDRVIMRTVAELDPHSAFIPAKEVQAVNEELEGSFEGIGVEFSIIMDTLVVVAPVAGGPSEAVGIFAADRIVAVNETSIAGIGLTNQGVYSHLRGPKGTKVSLTVVRKGVSEPLRFVVTRDKIPMNSIDAAYEALPDIAYLRINRFAFTTMTEFIDAISSKFTRKPKGVILDLRGNPGGLMLTALQIAEQFMERGNLLVFTEGMHIERQEEFASGMGFFIKTPVVVLIDEGSASASEILAGALQDWDRGILIGRRSFGKGLVQHALSLVDGSQLRLTVARYHTPTGRVIQTPYTKGDKEGYYQQLLDRYARGELFSKDSIRFLDSLSYRTLVNKRTVYGGGGIMPDIFIPQDTTGYTPYWARIIRGGMVTEFMNTYIDQERSLLSAQYKEFDAFKKHYQLPDSVVENLLNFAEQKGVSRDEEALAISLPLIRTQIKALIARTLFDSSAYVQLINEWNDPAYNMALEVITNWSRYEKEVLGK
ncbi:MAG: S41 family peptidase, partial [Bacteroidetes bacterium]|nr:S41 family peptidase [Bacteroidota bacterium]